MTCDGAVVMVLKDAHTRHHHPHRFTHRTPSPAPSPKQDERGERGRGLAVLDRSGYAEKEAIAHRREREIRGAVVVGAGIVYHHRPFYAPDIYNSAKEIIRVYNKEPWDYAYDSPAQPGYWEKGEQRIRDMDSLVESVCDAIRRRIWSEEPAGDT